MNADFDALRISWRKPKTRGNESAAVALAAKKSPVYMVGRTDYLGSEFLPPYRPDASGTLQSSCPHFNSHSMFPGSPGTPGRATSYTISRVKLVARGRVRLACLYFKVMSACLSVSLSGVVSAVVFDLSVCIILTLENETNIRWSAIR